MGFTIMKLVLIAVAVVFYIFVYKALSSNRRSSRAANFSVGGRKRREKDVSEMNREERLRKHRVSLRGGAIFKRRH
ncbi:MAG: hypothetical protein FVQ81_13470 [Candidatus Glassbacteria bacterium]|nr:hypothetical protein [Candidatus Glassbacteria bacterium]